MHYQPIINLATSEVVGFEALMRWNHPERGWVAHDVFIPLAEKSDLIVEFGDFALREALIAASGWSLDNQYFVTVNVSAHQFSVPGLTKALTGRYSEHHAFSVRVHLNLIDEFTRAIETLSAQIEEEMIPFQSARDLMATIPGISTKVADVIIAETGADMSRFPTAGHLSGLQRVGGSGEVHPHASGQPLFELAGPRDCGHGGGALARHLTTPRSIDGSRHVVVRSKPSSLSSTPCSWQSGTCYKPARPTATPATTSTRDDVPTRPRLGHSISYETWATPLLSSQRLRLLWGQSS